jgi:RNA polymerase sigma-70 factor (ECF subfamily)
MLQRIEVDVETTQSLIHQLRAGDDNAKDRLFARCLPLLNRWARGRLPLAARNLIDTADVVQVTLLRALNRLDTFEPQRQGSFMAYMRTILMNAVRDEIRRAGRQPDMTDRIDSLPVGTDTVLRNVANEETLAQYERSLATLTDSQREAVILRLEFGMTFVEIAEELCADSPNAVRMLVSRGLVRLAENMQ